MNINKKEVLDLDRAMQALTEERRVILSNESYLSQTEIDRIFDIGAEIDHLLECQSMLLPLIEDPKTADRWLGPGMRAMRQEELRMLGKNNYESKISK
ncbi:MAG: hypothetical protein Q7S19_00705 [bacterium]|nr:hypothetical protein [bacterium]